MLSAPIADITAPYLSAVVEDLHVRDISLFNGSLRTLIAETSPDTAIIVAGLERLVNFDLSDVIEDRV